MKRAKKKHVFEFSILAIILIIIIWIVWTNTNFTTSHITIKNNKIPDEFRNFKIAQIADLHNHQWGNKLIISLENEQPDIIVVTGDLVDSSHTAFAMEFINRAVKIAPVYYVTGNHEASLTNYDELESKLAAAGVNMMDDKREWLIKNTAKINLVGIQDPDFVEQSRESIDTTKIEPLLSKDDYNVVLCHRPELFDKYVKMQADLVLTGHAHGGLLRIPFIGGIVAPNQGFFTKYTKGVYSQNGTDMVVSRGLGNSIVPVRINNTAELVIISLTNQ